MTAIDVLVPLKAFSRAKFRLAATLSSSQRRNVVQNMATRVVEAAGPLPVWVVSDDAEVIAWAYDNQIATMSEKAPDLNSAVFQAVCARTAAGARRIIIAHGDLPLAQGFDSLTDVDGVKVITDQSQTGTKVLSIPTGSEFNFQYGPASAGKHQAEAERLNLPVEVVVHPRLSFDINTAHDLSRLAKRYPHLCRELFGTADSATR